MSMPMGRGATNKVSGLRAPTREGHVIQTLAHVSWFFETFLLRPYLSGYQPFHPRFNYLFNPYHEQLKSG